MSSSSTLNSSIRVRKQKDLQDAFNFITSGDVKSRVLLDLHVDTIFNVAYVLGLSADQLGHVIKALTTRRFKKSICVKLVRSLVPIELVPEKYVIQLLSWITTEQPSYNARAVVLRWVIIVYDYIDHVQHLHSLYSVIFFFLRSDQLRRPACQLLYMMTRKEDCTKFRARQLTKLRLHVGSEPHLDCLLSLYKLFYPDYLPTLSLDAHKAVPRNLDKKWIDSVKVVREKNKSRSVSNEVDQSSWVAYNSLPAKPKKAKRAKFDIPEISRAYCGPGEITGTEREGCEPMAFVTVKSFRQFCRDVHRLQIPGRVGTALTDTCLRHYVSAIRDVIVNQRLSYWLQHSLYEVFLNAHFDTTNEDKDKLLDAITHFSSFLQESVPVCDMFLECYFMQWDGHTHRAHLLALLGHQTHTPVTRLKEDILAPLYTHYMTSPPTFKCEMVETLTRMVRRMASSDWRRYVRPHQYSGYLCRMFDDGDVDSNPVHTMRCVIHYMDELTLLTLPSDCDNVSLMHSILSFYECVSRVHMDYNVPFIHLVPPPLVYAALFSSHSVLYDLVLRILALNKLSVVSMKKSADHRKIYGLRASFTDRFNELAINVLPLTCRPSRSRSRLPAIFASSGFMQGRSAKGVVSSLSVYRHSAYAPHSLTYLPINTRELRTKYLAGLECAGLSGVNEFRAAMVTPSTGVTMSYQASPGV